MDFDPKYGSGMAFHAMLVFAIGSDFLCNSVLGHCGNSIHLNSLHFQQF